MADTKITALAAITTVDPAADVLPIVDISDTSMAASGTTKKITSNQILGAGGTATLASATITGDLTVDTSTLKVDSANNRVGIGTASPANQLSVRNEGASGIAVIDVRGGSAGAGAVQISGNATTLGTTSFDLLQNSAGAFVNQRDANPLSMFVNGSERYAISSTGVATWSNVGGVAGTAMTLNSTGLGVGVTPSAWGSYGKVVEFGGGAVISDSGNNECSIAQGAYNSSGWKYKYTGLAAGLASNYQGTHVWYTAPSGTAGNAISWTQAMTLDASGILMVGTTNSVIWNTTNTGCVVGGNAFQASRSDDVSLLLNRLGSNGKIALFARQGGEVGDISVTTTGTTFNSTSDYRLKEAVAPLSGGLARVNALKPSIYNWKSNGSTGEGFLAHELAEVVPAAVTGEKDAVNEDGSIKAQSIDMSRVVPILVAAIQELTAEVNALKKA